MKMFLYCLTGILFVCAAAAVLLLLWKHQNVAHISASCSKVPADYRDFQPKRSSRAGESIEWSTSYIYNRRDKESPRVLLIGDSICNNYQALLRQKLADRGNITFWASSYCVTDPAYFKQLDIVLETPTPDVILFNNGLHSFKSDADEWLFAYTQAAKFIQAKHPGVKLFLVTSTPLKADPAGHVARINAMTLQAAQALQLPVIDLFTFTDKLDRNLWSDAYHIGAKGRELQAQFLAEILQKELPATANEVRQQGTATGPSGSLK